MEIEEYYTKKIYKSIDFISLNLSQKLSIDDICQFTGFSTSHFHRIFKAFTGESLYAYLNRIRVEKAASILLTRELSLLEISSLVGFEDPSTFARAFKKRFNYSASQWLKFKKSKIHQDILNQPLYNENISIQKGELIKPTSVAYKTLLNKKILAIDHIGDFYGNSNIFKELHYKLMGEIELNNVNWEKDKGIYIVYHDSAGITDKCKMRISYGVIPTNVLRYDGICKTIDIENNNYLLASFKIDNHDYGKAWTTVYRDIIPTNGMEPVDGVCFENYKNDCYNSITKKTELTIGVPVKKI